MPRDLFSTADQGPSLLEQAAAPPARPRDAFAWPDPAAPSYFDLVAARGWLMIRRFRKHVDCSLMRSEFWPSAEDFMRDVDCSCDQCFWRRRTMRDGSPDARGQAAQALQNRIRRYTR